MKINTLADLRALIKKQDKAYKALMGNKDHLVATDLLISWKEAAANVLAFKKECCLDEQ